jgi:SAM-dependent methyltransferase
MTQAPEHDESVRQFYETYGWEQGSSGRYQDAEAFVDTRPVMDEYHRRRDQRVTRLLAGDGPLLDLGCGGAPLLVETGDDLRVNVDFAVAALRGARQALGTSATYLQADICRLPFPADTFGRVLCAHVLYHITPERQLLALKEISRVLRPGASPAAAGEPGSAGGGTSGCRPGPRCRPVAAPGRSPSAPGAAAPG